MVKFLRVSASVIKWMGTVGVILCSATLVIILLLTAYEAVIRYAFHARTVYAVEMGQYFMIVISFLSGAYVLRRDRHIRMDLLYMHLSPRTKPFFDIVIELCCLAYCFVLFRTGYDLTMTAIREGAKSSTVLFTPLAPIYAIFPVSAVLLGLQYLVTLGGRFKALSSRGG